MQWLRDYPFYNGNKQGKRVSVSEISGDDVLQMYLRRAFNLEREDKITQATLGSIFDLGMREIARESGLTSMHRVEKLLPNGWILSGEGDLYDSEKNIIYDVKLTKIYALEQWKKEPNGHQYTKQLNWYRILCNESAELRLLWFLKDQTETKADHPKEALVQTVVPRLEQSELLKEASEKIELLEMMLENGVGKDVQCKDTWGGLRCKLYCEAREVCPYAKSKGFGRTTPEALKW